MNKKILIWNQISLIDNVPKYLVVEKSFVAVQCAIDSLNGSFILSIQHKVMYVITYLLIFVDRWNKISK